MARAARTKDALFILPLTERLTNSPFSDFEEPRILDTVLLCCCSSRMWLFHLVEALPNKHQTEPLHKAILPAPDHWPMLDATDTGIIDTKVVFSYISSCARRSCRAERALESQVKWFRTVRCPHLGAGGLFDLSTWSPLAWLLLLLLFLSMLTLLSKCIQRGGRERGRQWSGDVLNADTINKSLIVKI